MSATKYIGASAAAAGIAVFRCRTVASSPLLSNKGEQMVTIVFHPLVDHGFERPIEQPADFRALRNPEFDEIGTVARSLSENASWASRI